MFLKFPDGVGTSYPCNRQHSVQLLNSTTCSSGTAVRTLGLGYKQQYSYCCCSLRTSVPFVPLTLSCEDYPAKHAAGFCAHRNNRRLSSIVLEIVVTNPATPGRYDSAAPSSAVVVVVVAAAAVAASFTTASSQSLLLL